MHSALGYVTPADKLAGREAAIFAELAQKLAAARERCAVPPVDFIGRLRKPNTEKG
jgi:hypothetical protein